MPKVSVIVPVYNVKKYLNECLDSIAGQTLKDIEIICIDDGSTDGSGDILDQFARSDSRFCVLHKQNEGYGAAMNDGITLAHGEYLGIVESDDYIHPEMYEVLYEKAHLENLQIVKADFSIFQKKMREYIWKCKLTGEADLYENSFNPQEDVRGMYSSMYTWAGIYQTAFIRQNHIMHNHTPGASYQDNGFWFQTWMYAERAAFVNRDFYRYRKDNAESSIYSKGKMEAFSKEYQFIHDQIAQSNIPDKRKYYSICAEEYLAHEMESLYRVDETKLDEMMNLMKKEAQKYWEGGEYDLRYFPESRLKEILFYLFCQEEAKKEILAERKRLDEIRKLFSSENKIILYGGGVFARNLIGYLIQNHIIIGNLICGVTSITNSDNKIDIPVTDIACLTEDPSCPVIVCASPMKPYYKDMQTNLRKLGFTRIYDAQKMMTGMVQRRLMQNNM